MSSAPKTTITLEEVKIAYTRDMLAEHSWNVTECAKAMGIERVTLYRMIKRYKLKRPKE